MPGITRQFCDNKIKILEEQIITDNNRREIEKEISNWNKIKRELLRNEITRELRREVQFRREIRQMINNIIINSLNTPD